MTMAMKANVGGADRMLRLVAGVALLAVALLPALQFAGTGVGAWVAGIVGAVLVVTGLMRRCPAYGLLSVSTCPARQRP
jgi:hypothetical protein